MILNLAEPTSNAMLDTVAGRLNGGSIELLADTGNLLARMKLGNPAAAEAVGSELVFNQIHEEDAALATGVAASARILGRDDSEVFSCDCGDANSDAVIKLTPVLITRGAPVRIDSFKLQMP